MHLELDCNPSGACLTREVYRLTPAHGPPPPPPPLTHTHTHIHTHKYEYENFLKILKNYYRPPETVWNFRESYMTSDKCPRTIWDFWEPFKTSKKCLRFPWSFWYFWELFRNFKNSETYENSLKVLRTA